MKKTILVLLLLFPLLAIAKFHEGVVTLNNGTIKTGFINIILSTKKIRFKSSENSGAESIKIADIKVLYIINDGVKVEFLTLYLAELHGKKGYVANKKKSLVRIDIKARLNLVSWYYFTPAAGIAPEISARLYFFHKPGEDIARFIYIAANGHEGYLINDYKSVEKNVTAQFENDCPEMVKNLDRDAFKEKSLPYLIELYEQYCGK